MIAGGLEMVRVQPAVVAGMFYPADPEQLRSDIKVYLEQAEGKAPAPRKL